MNHVILNQLGAGDDVPDKARVVGHLDLKRIFDRSNARESVDHCAHSADSLSPDPGLARVAALEDQLNAAEHAHFPVRVNSEIASKSYEPLEVFCVVNRFHGPGGREGAL